MGRMLVEKAEKGVLLGWYKVSQNMEVFRHKVRCSGTRWGVQAQGEVWVHFSGPEQLRVRLEKWAETTLIPNWWIHRWYLVCIWVLLDLHNILLFFFLKIRFYINPHSWFFLKKQSNLATVAPRDNTWLEGEWWTFRMTAFSHRLHLPLAN